MIKLKVKNIEMALQELDIFAKPKVELEQYVTDPRTAAEVLFMIEKVANARKSEILEL